MSKQKKFAYLKRIKLRYERGILILNLGLWRSFVRFVGAIVSMLFVC